MTVGARRALEEELALAERNISYLRAQIVKLERESDALMARRETAVDELQENIHARDECRKLLDSLRAVEPEASGASSSPSQETAR